jgi:hypothetical protein
LKLDCLARDLMIQEHIIADLQRRGINLISVAEPDLRSDDPSRKMMRQIMGAIAEYDKSMVVLKLRGARLGEAPVLATIQDMRAAGESVPGHRGSTERGRHRAAARCALAPLRGGQDRGAAGRQLFLDTFSRQRASHACRRRS